MDKEFKKIISPIQSDLDIFEQKLKGLIEEQNNFLKDDLISFLFNKPKRLRVIFIYLISKILKIEKDVLNIALATELLHSASLLHDDVIDEETKRREKLTFFEKYSSKLAILEGDFLLSLALKVLSNEKKEIVAIFSNKILKTIQAEILQYENKNKVLSIDGYLDKTFNKTGNLFLAGIEALFEFCENDLAEKNKIIECVKNYSLAFQIKNDIDNFKKDLSDYKNGNYTLPVIYFSKENPIGKIDFSNEKFDKYIKLSIEKMNEIKKLSLDNLEKIENSAYKNALKELIIKTLGS
ncbi:MAG: polyprenyl synthetase family protein [Candidatus Gastranaerophilales bacterium]|nr:polyprenyl synthetase family protein [Candidatus Gastranaerophilales bacterium]